jgi:hypothetical protein
LLVYDHAKLMVAVSKAVNKKSCIDGRAKGLVGPNICPLSKDTENGAPAIRIEPPSTIAVQFETSYAAVKSIVLA